MDQNLQLFMEKTKLGIVFLEKLLPLMSSAEQTVLHFTYLFTKMFNKFYCLRFLPKKKDKLFNWHGSI